LFPPPPINHLNDNGQCRFQNHCTMSNWQWIHQWVLFNIYCHIQMQPRHMLLHWWKWTWHNILHYEIYNQNQNEFENIVALHLSAFNKWVDLEFNFPNNVVNIKRRQKILSMICFMSSNQEIVALMACLYLLWNGPFYESHEFAILFIRHFLNILMNV
jgi:hypothetical protein